MVTPTEVSNTDLSVGPKCSKPGRSWVAGSKSAHRFLPEISAFQADVLKGSTCQPLPKDDWVWSVRVSQRE